MSTSPTISLIFPYYENPEMLAYQLSYYATFPGPLQASMELIIVDDCSQNYPAADVVPTSYPMSISVYRIDEDKPWNQDAARNIGAFEARGEYLLLTDVDHIAPAATVKGLIGAASPGRIITMGRKAHFSDVEKPSHVNSYFLSRALYWEIGGYDEDFWGTYGSDRIFRKHLECRGQIELYDNLKLELVTQGSIPDAKNKVFSRRPTLLRRIRGLILRVLKQRGVLPFPRAMSNSYHRVR